MLRQARSISLRALRRCSMKPGGNMPSRLLWNSSRAALEMLAGLFRNFAFKVFMSMFSFFSHRLSPCAKMIIARTRWWGNMTIIRVKLTIAG